MSERRLPPLANLPHRVRAGLAGWPVRFREWRAALGRDPRALWRSAPIRVGLWLLLGVGLTLGLRWLIAGIAPGGGETLFVEPTPHATLYVACTNPECRAHFTSKQPMDFDGWPLTCPQCGQQSVYRAQVCPRCRRWFATAPGESVACPLCAAKAPPEEPGQPATQPSTTPDDDEDPW